MLVFSMATMDMAIILAMPTMDTMDTHMPTTMATTMARGPLMPSPLLLLSPRLMLSTDTDTDLPTMDMDMLTMDMDMDTTDMDMPTMDTMDTHMPTMDTSMVK